MTAWGRDKQFIHDVGAGYSRRDVLKVLLPGVMALGAVGAKTARAASGTARARLERIAASLPFFVPLDLVYRRKSGRGFRDVSIDRAFADMTEATDPVLPTDDLKSLLKHPDPKIRTLALAALFNKDDPKLLPLFVPLASDTATTFPTIQIFHQGGVTSLPPLSERAAPQTVGDVARSFLLHYMAMANMRLDWATDAATVRKQFAAYWEPRRNRKWSAGWFQLRLWRAAPDARFPEHPARIAAVRREIDRLKPVDRTMVLLYLGPRTGFATEEEIVAACRALGPDRMLDLLRGGHLSDDPDLLHDPRDSGGNEKYRERRQHHVGMALFVLRHAETLLRPDQAETLYALTPLWRDASRSPAFVIAAATLNPAKAPEWLRGEQARLNGEFDDPYQADIANALWRLGGQGMADDVREWFYAAPLAKPDTNGVQNETFQISRARFLVGPSHEGAEAVYGNYFARHPSPENRAFIGALVRDSRFGKLGQEPLRVLLDIAEAWIKRPLLDALEVAKVQHPMGSRVLGNEAYARQTYPDVTQKYLDSLEAWRMALCEAFDDGIHKQL